MKTSYLIVGALLLLLAAPSAFSDADPRVLVKLPAPMQAHLLHNMRGHLEVIDRLLLLLSEQRLDQASDLAESELGMSSLSKHGASHIAPFYPEEMRQAGTRMHHAASRFALVAQEGDVLAAYKSLRTITEACTACHAGYRVH